MTAEQERPCRHCNGADPFCSVCEGVGSLPNLPSEPVQKVHEMPSAEQEREAVVRWLRDDAKAADEQAKRFAERGKYQHALEMQHHAETQRLNAVTIARGEHIKETSDDRS